VLVGSDPGNEIFREEYFGPVLSVYVWDDAPSGGSARDAWGALLTEVDAASRYALTGSVISRDRAATALAMERLRFAAGNFYVNDKSTGAVVGQQPFGGGRASGTNDKAGAAQNLLRWTSTRAIKETLVPPTDVRYPHMG
jgi:1-pyrroline-5-carboxylate dehydrogenase